MDLVSSITYKAIPAPEGIRAGYIDVRFLEDIKAFNQGLSLVSPARREKVLKHCFLKDRVLSLGAGLLLSLMLKTYGIDEKSAEYILDERGKPHLKAHHNLEFSLTHSGIYAGCAISACPVGIDIEEIIPYPRDAEKECMTPEELQHLDSLKEEERVSEFIRLWVRKESYLKAAGMGLTESSKSFSVLSDGEAYGYEEFPLPGYRGALCFPFNILADNIH